MTEPAQRPGRSRQDFATPPELVDAVERRFGPMVCDLAASAENAKAPVFIDRERDTLTVPWADEHPTGNLWINPEFANLDPYAAKCAHEAPLRLGLIFMLSPASIDSNWFARHVNKRAFVLGLNPRVTFEGCTAPYPKPLMISVFGLGLVGFDQWRWKS